MGFRRHFATGLILRLVVVLAALCLLAAALMAPGLAAARIVAALLVFAAVWTLWQHIRRTNEEIARFVEAVRFGDMQARFSRPGAGAGFEHLGSALDAGMLALREERGRLIDAARFSEALVDDVPIALLTIDPTGAVTLANKAARKLFNRHEGARPSDYGTYGQALPSALIEMEAGQSRTIILDLDVGPQRAIVRAGALARLGGTVRVFAVQVIQHSLNAVEIASQSGLVRVLTHEIMNSLTPVTSLAHSAAQLVALAQEGDESALTDARMAVETLAKRADGVMHFVESYREITRPPRVARKLFRASHFAQELERLVRAEPRWGAVALTMKVVPETHLIDADPDLLAQVVINLMRNAADAALESGEEPRVAVTIAGLKSGRTRIAISDNGPGVPDSIREDIFLPFMTTKAKGTGVGLSFARQVVLGHDGSIELLSPQGGGALFRIVL